MLWCASAMTLLFRSHKFSMSFGPPGSRFWKSSRFYAHNFHHWNFEFWCCCSCQPFFRSRLNEPYFTICMSILLGFGAENLPSRQELRFHRRAIDLINPWLHNTGCEKRIGLVKQPNETRKALKTPCKIYGGTSSNRISSESNLAATCRPTRNAENTVSKDSSNFIRGKEEQKKRDNFQ